MAKFISTALIAFFLCIFCVEGFDRRLQNANLDFINFETNKATPSSTSVPLIPTPFPKPTIQNQNTGLKTSPRTTLAAVVTGTSTTVKPTTPPSNVRQLIKTFNDRTTDVQNQNAGNVLPMPINSQRIPPSNPNQPNIQSKPGVATSTVRTPTPPKAPFPSPVNSMTNTLIIPSLPKVVVTTEKSQTTQKSWASVVSGKESNKPAVLPGQRTPGSNQPQSNVGLSYPPLPGTQGSLSSSTAPEIASDKELKETSEALFRKENPNVKKHITINYQSKTSSFSKDDAAPQPLLTIQPELWNVPTIAAMKALLDNYEQDTTVNEYVTPLEKNEENAFLDAVMATPVMRQLMVFLKEKGVVTADPKEQRDVIKQIWFNMYSRGQGKIGSSGFEHIFLSEIKNNEISGLHNWLYFSIEEAAKRANYLGYLKKLELSDKSGVLKSHFTLNGIDKPVNSMFVGTSPELEMALYSLCFLTRVDKPCPLSLGGKEFSLRTHNFRYRSKNMIGSAFPEIQN